MKPLTALLTGLLIGSPVLTEKLLAAEWETGAGLSLGAEFSDNICLSATDKTARGFATVTPDINVRGRGARTNVNLNGSVRYNTLADSDFSCSGSGAGNRETLIPSLRYRGDYELIQNALTLESNASARTTNIDPFAPGDADGGDGRGNVNVVYHYGAGARLQRQLFNSADMLLRYSYNEQHNGARVLGNSSESRSEFDLGTDRTGSRLTLGVSGRYSKVMYDGTAVSPAFDNTLSSAEARASLRMGSSWRLSVMGGEEWNEFISLRPGIDGTYWDTSLRWSPNDRMEVDVGTGERFFGTTPRASIRYRHRRSELTASYNRTLALPRDLRAADGGFDDPFNPGEIPDIPPAFPDEPTFLGDTPIVNQRLRVGYQFSARQTVISLTAARSHQQRLEDLEEAIFSSLRLAISRSLSSTMSARLNLTLSERENEDAGAGNFGEPARTWRATFGLNRRLGSDTTISFDYQHTRRESDALFNRYTENRVIFSARHQF